jgi:hypothetical protein
MLNRIAKELSTGDAIEGLSHRLAPTDLQSLMMHVYRERSAARTPADLLAQYTRNALVAPSTANPRELLALEALAFEQASTFEAVDLAPVSPLGLNKVLGGIDQNNCLATIRNSEVLADPTTAMALECARRRRAGRMDVIKLCARGRMVRLQPFDVPGFSPHFAIFAMVSAGRDRGNLEFEMVNLREHLDFYARLLRGLSARGYRVGNIEMSVSDTTRNADRLRRVQAAVLEPLGALYPEMRFVVDEAREQGRHYYTGFCLSVNADDAQGTRVNLCDGGCTDWTQRLVANAKERMLVSAVGLEIIPKRLKH